LGGGVGADLDEPVAFVVGVVEAAGAGGGFEAGGEAEAAGDGQGGDRLFQAPAGGVEGLVEEFVISKPDPAACA
jgi:hypothetical protein